MIRFDLGRLPSTMFPMVLDLDQNGWHLIEHEEFGFDLHARAALYLKMLCGFEVCWCFKGIWMTTKGNGDTPEKLQACWQAQVKAATK